MKSQLGQTGMIALAPLSAPNIEKGTTKTFRSLDTDCFLISFCGLSVYVAALMTYGKQIELKVLVGLCSAV